MPEMQEADANVQQFHNDSVDASIDCESTRAKAVTSLVVLRVR